MKRFVVLGISMIAAACTSNSSTVPSAVSQGARPFVLQTNAPSTSQWEALPNGSAYDKFVAGADGHMWTWTFIGPTWEIDRVDPGTLEVQGFSLPAGAAFSDGQLTAGPDGNIWWCNEQYVGSITPGGIATTFSGPEGNCMAITSGSDGNLWLADGAAPQLVRVTTSGQFTTFAVPHPDFVRSVVGSKNGLIWFTEVFGHTGYVGTLNLATSKIQDWPLRHDGPRRTRQLDFLASGDDGNLYGRDINTNDLLRVKPDGTVKAYEHIFGNLANQENVRTIWGITESGQLGAWSARGQTLRTFGPPPIGAGNPVFGPDMNVWAETSVFIRRALNTTPSSATLSVGGQQLFDIQETKCPQCVWSATSSNPSIAQVSGVTSGQFKVTGVASGSASITVADKRQNVVLVPITVK